MAGKKGKDASGRKSSEDNNILLAIGSGVAENVYQLSTDLKPGQKYILEKEKYIGGSGLNYACRLINMGIPTLPIASLGNDPQGIAIQRKIRTLMEKQFPRNPILKFAKRKHLLCPDLMTPASTILSFGGDRTVLTEKLTEAQFKKLHAHIKRSVDRISESNEVNISAALIGHIYNDDQNDGAVTKYIIDKLSENGNTPIYLNLGTSQIRMGFDRWKKYLKKVTALQLSIQEMRKFFEVKKEVHTLLDAIHEFKQEGISAIITMDKFGGVATLKESNSIVLAWPFELGKSFVDATGAGDAFGAGVVSTWFHRGQPSGDFLEEIDEARKWSAYACTHPGGANNCPNPGELDKFVAKTKAFSSVAVQEIAHIDLILRMLDRFYS